MVVGVQSKSWSCATFAEGQAHVDSESQLALLECQEQMLELEIQAHVFTVVGLLEKCFTFDVRFLSVTTSQELQRAQFDSTESEKPKNPEEKAPPPIIYFCASANPQSPGR